MRNGENVTNSKISEALLHNCNCVKDGYQQVSKVFFTK